MHLQAYIARPTKRDKSFKLIFFMTLLYRLDKD